VAQARAEGEEIQHVDEIARLGGLQSKTKSVRLAVAVGVVIAEFYGDALHIVPRLREFLADLVELALAGAEGHLHALDRQDDHLVFERCNAQIVGANLLSAAATRSSIVDVPGPSIGRDSFANRRLAARDRAHSGAARSANTGPTTDQLTKQEHGQGAFLLENQ
jgi:hypothetical protein